jgi:hypothetical protein
VTSGDRRMRKIKKVPVEYCARTKGGKKKKMKKKSAVFHSLSFPPPPVCVCRLIMRCVYMYVHTCLCVSRRFFFLFFPALRINSPFSPSFLPLLSPPPLTTTATFLRSLPACFTTQHKQESKSRRDTHYHDLFSSYLFSVLSSGEARWLQRL